MLQLMNLFAKDKCKIDLYATAAPTVGTGIIKSYTGYEIVRNTSSERQKVVHRVRNPSCKTKTQTSLTETGSPPEENLAFYTANCLRNLTRLCERNPFQRRPIHVLLQDYRCGGAIGRIHCVHLHVKSCFTHTNTITHPLIYETINSSVLQSAL